ncbi:hypothetical protein L5515_011451 [Caenorhabditis briggsae]|uniref:Uncharacterized protein n=1 Tax=Caenorhabditis briggsae TaxID=6238 RepID=A0AAE9JGX9_CAEBR|nr:hypothetical protein L5515_011451 [Caenorhabditis briggsae]
MLSVGMYIWALHGAACTLALILANKPFRITVKEHLKYAGIKLLVSVLSEMSENFLPDNRSYYTFYKEQTTWNNYYKYACHFIPLFTVPIYAEALYCILYKCKPLSPKYVAMLQLNMFFHFLGEVFWSTMLVPVIVLPCVGLSVEGLWSVLHIPGKYQIFIVVAILQFNTATITHLLIYRLKFAIPPDAKYRKYVKLSADVAKIFIYFTVISCTCAFSLLNEDQGSLKNRIMQKFLVPPPNLWDDRYVLTDRDRANFQLFLYITIGEIVVFVANIIIIPIIAFHYLSAHRTEKSDRLAKAHKKTLQVLIFQLAIYCLFHLLPMVCLTCSAISEARNVIFLSLGMLIWALHGSACTLTLILANKPFRSTARAHLEYVFCCILCNFSPKTLNIGRRRESSVIQKIDFPT